MKMDYMEILDRNAVLLEVGKKMLPRKAAYAVSRNIKKLESEVKFYWGLREDIAARYAAKDAGGEYILEGNNYTFASPEDEAAYRLELTELNGTEVEVDVMKFRAEELDKCDTDKRYGILSPVEEAAIEWMVDYGEEP